jgi:hypothetical protein
VEWEKARPQYFNVLDKGEAMPAARADDFPRD